MQVPLAKDIFEKTFFKVFETLVEFLRASKERNLLRQSMDPFITSGLFFGSLVHLVRSEKMNRSMLGITLADPLLREKIIEQSINNLLMGCIDPSKRGVEP